MNLAHEVVSDQSSEEAEVELPQNQIEQVEVSSDESEVEIV